MDNNFGYYIFCIVAIAVGFFILKKVTGCMIKTIITIAILLALAACYYYIKSQC